MPGTFLGEVSTAQLVGGAQNVVALTPQTNDPSVSATTAQLYAKTDKNLYHEDTAGLVTNLLLSSQVANSALGPQTLEVGPFGVDNTSTHQIGYGFLVYNASGFNYVVKQRCSMIGVSAVVGTGGSATGNIILLKNGVASGTVLSVTAPSGTGTTPFYANFNNGVYAFAPGDQINFSYTSTGGAATAVLMAITLNAGSQSFSSVSTPLVANTAIASTDNHRVWLANAASQYTLTLPSTVASTDFYVRVTVTGTAGVIIAAQSGQQIYLGIAASIVAGNVVSTTVGSTIVLMNPAGTNLWIATNITGNWSVN